MKQKIKVILIGESAVGKTSLINAYQGLKFQDYKISNLDSSFFGKEIQRNGNTYNIQIWDTAGQERFRSMNKIYLKGSHIIIFVYDITKKSSFKGLKDFWVNYTKNLLGENPKYGLVGNKIDLIINAKNDTIITTEEGKNYADEIEAEFLETSAKEDSEGFINYVDSLINSLIDQNNGLLISNTIQINQVEELQENKKCKFC